MRIFARISMSMEVSESEYKELEKRSENGTLDVDLSDELAEKFIKDGYLDGDSYIPASFFDEVTRSKD